MLLVSSAGSTLPLRGTREAQAQRITDGKLGGPGLIGTMRLLYASTFRQPVKAIDRNTTTWAKCRRPRCQNLNQDAPQTSCRLSIHVERTLYDTKSDLTKHGKMSSTQERSNLGSESSESNESSESSAYATVLSLLHAKKRQLRRAQRAMEDSRQLGTSATEGCRGAIVRRPIH